MKKIDRLLLSSFIGPFAVSFGIALFVLIMQFLWLYIDEIAGKGVSIVTMLELIGYLSISVFPTALPIAVLIASVMVMGNLAERYELSSMKSAGISLLRVMRALMFCSAGIGFFSYLCSDFIIPIANLQFKSRLYDIRKQKPALTLEKGIFNEDFRQFVIRIGDKESDGETISDVMIEDQTNVGRLKFNQILADSGQMYTTKDKRYFVMNLFDGTQYQEPTGQGQQQRQKFPFVRTRFSSWTKVWDMKEFDMNPTDQDRFAGQRSMLSMAQLRLNMDSLLGMMNAGRQAIAEDMLLNLKRQPSPPPKVPVAVKPSPEPAKKQPKEIVSVLSGIKVKIANPKPVTPVAEGPKMPKQVLTKPLAAYSSLAETFSPEDLPFMLKDARVQAQTIRNLMEGRKTQVQNRRIEWVKTGYELYTKYSFALVCFIFLFIGAPMGAIIRKGGFGYPIL
ncbi:MAG: LptF/LptG family permease, partial [Saprospiraceae bacterium]